MTTIQAVTPAQFDQLCIVVIYHWVDMCWWRKRGKNDMRMVKKAMQDLGVEDEEEALALYNSHVMYYASTHLPERYNATYDYWGARCFSCANGWNYPRIGWYGGDEEGRWMWFENHAALEAYTNGVLERIEQGEEL